MRWQHRPRRQRHPRRQRCQVDEVTTVQRQRPHRRPCNVRLHIALTRLQQRAHPHSHSHSADRSPPSASRVTVAVCPTPAVSPLRTSFSNPAAVTSTEYTPGVSWPKRVVPRPRSRRRSPHIRRALHQHHLRPRNGRPAPIRHPPHNPCQQSAPSHCPPPPSPNPTDQNLFTTPPHTQFTAITEAKARDRRGQDTKIFTRKAQKTLYLNLYGSNRMVKREPAEAKSSPAKPGVHPFGFIGTLGYRLRSKRPAQLVSQRSEEHEHLRKGEQSRRSTPAAPPSRPYSSPAPQPRHPSSAPVPSPHSP